MASGVSVDNECLDVYQDLKLKQRYKYIIYKLSDDYKTIVVEKKMEKTDTSQDPYESLISHFPADDCRYAVYDFEYQVSASEGMRKKICFYVWAPDSAKVKHKMLYASSKDALRKKLVGISTEIQGTELSEVDYDAVLERVKNV